MISACCSGGIGGATVIPCHRPCTVTLASFDSKENGSGLHATKMS